MLWQSRCVAGCQTHVLDHDLAPLGYSLNPRVKVEVPRPLASQGFGGGGTCWPAGVASGTWGGSGGGGCDCVDAGVVCARLVGCRGHAALGLPQGPFPSIWHVFLVWLPSPVRVQVVHMLKLALEVLSAAGAKHGWNRTKESTHLAVEHQVHSVRPERGDLH